MHKTHQHQHTSHRQKFLDFKREHGTHKEKEMYKDMTPKSMAYRLIAKRYILIRIQTFDPGNSITILIT